MLSLPVPFRLFFPVCIPVCLSFDLFISVSSLLSAYFLRISLWLYIPAVLVFTTSVVHTLLTTVFTYITLPNRYHPLSLFTIVYTKSYHPLMTICCSPNYSHSPAYLIFHLLLPKYCLIIPSLATLCQPLPAQLSWMPLFHLPVSTHLFVIQPLHLTIPI